MTYFQVAESGLSLHCNRRDCSQAGKNLQERDKPRNTPNTQKANQKEICVPRISRIPRLFPPAFGCGSAALGPSHCNSRDCSQAGKNLQERDKPRNTRNTRKANREEVCFPRISRIPRSVLPAFGCGSAALGLCGLICLCSIAWLRVSAPGQKFGEVFVPRA